MIAHEKFHLQQSPPSYSQPKRNKFNFKKANRSHRRKKTMLGGYQQYPKISLGHHLGMTFNI